MEWIKFEKAFVLIGFGIGTFAFITGAVKGVDPLAIAGLCMIVLILIHAAAVAIGISASKPKNAIEKELEVMLKKLHAGTLHEGQCNANHDKPVGCDTCSCTLGREIKRLRRELDKAMHPACTCWRCLGLPKDPYESEDE